MRRAVLTAFVFAAPLLIASCATKPSAGSTRVGNIITAEDIERVEALTAYEAIRRLRPDFLRRARAPGGERSEVRVYIDGVRVGQVTELRDIHADDVARIRFMSASEATTRFGTGHNGGAILVTTR